MTTSRKTNKTKSNSKLEKILLSIIWPSPRSQSHNEMWLTGEKYDWLATWSRLGTAIWLTATCREYDWRRRLCIALSVMLALLAIQWGLYSVTNFICRFARKISIFCYNSQQILLLKFVGILKFVNFKYFINS